MKLRIEGTKEECAATLAALELVLDVRDASRFYPNYRRGGYETKLGRIYVDYTMRPDTTVQATAARLDREEPNR
ncbi:hypothetical protein ACVDFE_02210 [Lentzea chajnantorensis]